MILRRALQSPCILKSPYENQSAYAGFFVCLERRGECLKLKSG
nr:MAG TPA: hypothetical protein [Caudoviricetes sp.]